MTTAFWTSGGANSPDGSARRLFASSIASVSSAT
eukprot:CAMPEP_0185715476 /NCGR_PEP_ID=MMETSP1164-20130828/40876_1 /TAXON_ID=1104430 /ORGANISM="Chrysoreinhardia sp, Strain CCMP2950" /LENGTH=33 /DNA_ID= /DNA_START= /DNA_END= /DNA_ORIENTATION=